MRGTPEEIARSLLRPRIALLAGLAAVCLAVLLPALAAAAPRKPDFAISDTRSATRPHWACPEGVCDAIVLPHKVSQAVDKKKEQAKEGLGPAELRSAYDIPASGASGQTIAVVEGFAYKAAEADLATYRSEYGIPACTQAGGCFTVLGREGGSPAYKNGTGWEGEEALDLDMVSAACPECKIIVIDSEGESWNDLGTGVNTAVAHGATIVSNSYGLPDETCTTSECANDASDWDHPGIPMFIASGDYGWDNYLEGASTPSYPAEVPWAVAVGGTKLTAASNARGWTETVWGEPHLGVGTGSGCTNQPKPAWQHDTGCRGRMENDVAAVGACSSPLSVYDSLEGGWTGLCGTSAATPLVAGIEAHATAYARSLSGARAFYEDPGALTDITKGTNGKCPKAEKYFCHAAKGYDGPTGLGVPAGPLQLTE